MSLEWLSKSTKTGGRMKLSKSISILIAIAIPIVILSSCENYFGSKTDLGFIDKPVFQNRNIAYVPILPVLEGYAQPVDIVTGFDELIYIADAGTEEVVVIDQSGREIGRVEIPGLTAIAQDRKLDILAVGTYDTTLTVSVPHPTIPDSITRLDSTFSLSCIYRVDQSNGTSLDINSASVKAVVKNPYFRKSTFSFSDVDRKFTGLAVLADNSYYATFDDLYDSDDGVFVFASKEFGESSGLPFEDDDFISPINVSVNGELRLDYFKDPSSITTLVQAPQQFFMTTRRDFIFTSVSENTTLKVQYIELIESVDGAVYEVRDFTTGDTSVAEGFLYTPNRFERPVDVTFTGDGTNYLFVVDEVLDSLFQFTNTGLEGIKPPAAAENQKHIKASFGGTDPVGQEVGQFNGVSGVAYADEILYVADAGNGRVLRYKLTLDFD